MRLLQITALSAALLSLGSAGAAAQPRNTASGPVLPTRHVVDGVTILQHSADAFTRAPQWTLAAAPLATAGGADAPDFDLTNVAVAEILSDGRLVTLSRIGNRLYVFGADGRGEQSLGRQGQGPGEIMAPGGMTRIKGDTLVIPDPANRRINWITVAKGFVADRPLPAIPNGHFVSPVGVLRTGDLVLSTAGLLQNTTADSLTRPTASVVLLPPRTGSVTDIATLPDLELLRLETRYRGRARMEAMPVRFTRSAMAIVWDTVIATGSGDGYRIDLRAPTGKVGASLRVAVPRRPVTSAMRDSTIAAGLRRFEGQQAERLVDRDESIRIERARPFADSLPPYGSWFVTPNQTLWVVDARATGDTRGGAAAFRQDGAIIARLTWSSRGYPMAFGDDRIVMREVDADDVVALRVFRMQPGPR